MHEDCGVSNLPPINRLLQASMNIQSGRKGVDFLVLENDDEMCGYSKTPFENDFCDAVKLTVDLLVTQGVAILTNDPHIGCDIITALVQVQSAANAYRSRMFQYATDWGSEISPVGGCQRELFTCFKELLPQISVETRQRILSGLSNDLKRKFIFTYYWTSSDSHSSSSISVLELLTEF